MSRAFSFASGSASHHARVRLYSHGVPDAPDPIETDDVVVLIVGAPGGPYGPGYLPGVTRLEKLIFLLERETAMREWLTQLAEFRSHRFGPFSARIYRAVNELVQAGLLVDSADNSSSADESWESQNLVGDGARPYTNRTFRLTDIGTEYYGEVLRDLPPQAEATLRGFKDRFAGLPLRQLVRYVYQRYPDFTDKSEIRDDILR